MNTSISGTAEDPTVTINGIDIAICTYNRLAYLKKCVASILPQLSFPETRLTIIDNRSDDGTAEWVHEIMTLHPQLHYIFEEQQGLSYGRNTAARQSSYSHILYIDDDCIIPESFTAKALSLLQAAFEWDGIGGPYYAVYEGRIPEKNPDDAFSFALPYDTPTILMRDYIRGGCMMFKTDVLRKMGGFDTSLGMKGHHTGYGEEIELQQRMRLHNYKMAYAPDLYVYHAVRPEKERIRWKLFAAYARRRDKRLFDPLPLHVALWLVIKTIGGRFLWTPVHLLSWIIKPTYSWQQCVTDILEPLLFSWGEWIGSIRSAKRKRG